MIRRPPRSTRTDTLFPYTTLFRSRVSPDVRANYLASPPLVVAYALKGTVTEDFTTTPIGQDQDGKDVFLADIWPTNQEVADAIAGAVDRDMRSEEHTSELQSLMRISYAVFCLKKKKQPKHNSITTQ